MMRNEGSIARVLDKEEGPGERHSNTKVDRSFVLVALRDLTRGGLAEWVERPGGAIEVRLCSGEIYLLGEVEITRMA